MVGYCVLKKFIVAIIYYLWLLFVISACASDLSTETLQNVARVLWMYDYDPSNIPKTSKNVSITRQQYTGFWGENAGAA